MELASYADRAVSLVNTADPYRHRDTLTTCEQAKELLATEGRCRVTNADVAELRAIRDRLREVFDAAEAGRVPRAVQVLNSLMKQYPIRPVVTDHDGASWHLHLAEGAPTIAAVYGAKAAMGLAVQATELGFDRLGVCQAAPCREVFIDTSTNRSRRYCSDRCATRANVAAYRARRKEQARAAAAASEAEATAAAAGAKVMAGAGSASAGR
ncbi:CGNR zinc finger domain-containing protein [Catenulispora sp. NF23]|uniref:CGNR zinc finger domain-containing protein n=1 Tax=Catenulispora pinistramenti TaxID=2705254 RepID=UPI001BAC0808|nr:CGNR zinc finger domain-containing protein [Catenulispora pinistramenti]MBS2536827.1 CGNR zinc finger domain-containing protein [Catenulispora pinistramenti]